jgi:myo-inositol 2-dehydrogenase/D-chiro-inositol 1-dehydrogenase
MQSSSLLRIALLGADDGTPAIARAILDSDQFELAGICEFERSSQVEATELRAPAVGRVRRFDGWEALLDLETVDAVVVARTPDEDRRAEQLRKLIQAGMPLLVSHPVVDSMLVYYELDMIRRETGCVVVPCLFARHHPAAQILAAIVCQGTDSPLGKIDQLLVERCIAEPTKAGVVSQFARDVDLIRAIAGDMTRLGAMAGAAADSAYGSLGVQMSGPSGVAARWSVIGIQAADGAKITLLGSKGKATVDERPGSEPWILELTTPGHVDVQPQREWDPAAAALVGLAGAIRGERADPDWVDAARSVELAETIDRSLKKGRTIELYYEDYTEAGTFKGTMASVGCGLLLLGLFLLGAVAIVEQLGVPYVRSWPYLLVGVLGAFLVSQLLMLASRKPDSLATDRPAQDREPPAAL